MEELDKVADTITIYNKSFIHLELPKPLGETREVWVSKYPARTRTGEVIVGKTSGEENYILGDLSKSESVQLTFPDLKTLIELYESKQTREFRKNVLENYSVRTNLLIRYLFPKNEMDVREVSGARFVDDFSPTPQKQAIENARGNVILKAEIPNMYVVQARYRIDGPCLQKSVAEKSGGFGATRHALPTEKELKVTGKLRWEGVEFEEHLASVMMERLEEGYTPRVRGASTLLTASWNDTPIATPIFTTQNPHR